MAGQVEVGHAGSGHHAMLVGGVVTTCLPDCGERLCGAAAFPDERPGQGHRDPGPAPPTRRAVAPIGKRKGEVHPGRTCRPRCATAPPTTGDVMPARLLVRPDTILRWHRDLVTRRHAARSKPKRLGRPPTVRSIRVLVLRLVRDNPSWGYRRVHGELLVLGVKVAASTVWEILQDAGIDPAPKRASSTWAGFLRSQARPCWPVTSLRRSPCPGRGCMCWR